MTALRARGRALGREIGVYIEPGTAFAAEAAALAHELELPVVSAWGSPPWKYLLVRTPQRLELHDNRDRRARPCYVEARVLAARCNLSRRQPLARAVGARVRRIVDATAGLGQDALLLAAMGYEVIALERSPVVAALLRDGVARAQHDQRLARLIGDRLRVLNVEARELIPQLRPRPDTIYIDPMFPPKRRRSALPPKRVRWLRDLVGDDADAAELAELCLRFADKRVVIKRADDAPALLPAPNLSYRTKLVRYDVYLKK